MTREMKDSGVEWVGKIPINWSIRKGKYILNLLNRCIEENSGVVTCFRDGQVTLRENRRTEGFTNAVKEIGYQGVKPGDLVVHGMDGFAGAIGISDSIGKMSPIINVLDSNQNKKYLMYYLRSMAFENVFLATATGIRERSCDLRWNKLANLEYPIPPLSEQKKIADFLDEKVKEINNAIEKTKETIELYKKYKQAIITEAVTKGLDPNVEMKESGVEWIGQVPDTWKVVKAKYIFENHKEIAGKNQDKYDRLSLTLKGVLKRSRDDTKGLQSESLETYQILRKGELVFKMIDLNNVSTSRVGYSPYEGLVSPVYIIFHNPKYSRFGYYYFFSMWQREIYNHLGNDGVRSSLNASDMLSLPFLLPPLSEQQKIVDFLDEKCIYIDSLIENKNNLLKEIENYKKSLIYEYVTGKKEVK